MDAFTVIDKDQYEYSLDRQISRGTLVQASIADIHFGAIDPKAQYDVLYEQFICELYKLPVLDAIFINGDLFHKKYPNAAASDEVLYASIFMAEIRNLAVAKQATVILLSGTKSHDADQLSLFYHYLYDPEFDIRIVQELKFEYVKGSKVLCIPELYDVDEEIYKEFLFNSGWYDQAIIHGTFDGAIYGNNAGRSRLFTINDFVNCRGPILAGHVHVAGCYNKYFYYSGSPIRWQHGEEKEKGFMITLFNLDNGSHYTHMIPITSFRYRVVNFDDLAFMTIAKPEDVIKYLNDLKEKDHIDYLRLDFNMDSMSQEDIDIIKKYYQTDETVKFKTETCKSSNMKSNNTEELNRYNYIFDPNLDEYQILSRYINDKEGKLFITAEQLRSIILDDKFDF